MVKHSLLLLSGAILLISGCSSYPSDAKGVAIKACEAVKLFDFETIKTYASKDQHAQLDMAKKMMDTSTEKINALPEAERKQAQEAMAMQKEKLKSIDCSTMEISEGENGIKLAALTGVSAGQNKMKLKQIEGIWKIIQ